MHLVLGWPVRDPRLPPIETVAAIEAHRRLVFHEDPRMQLGTLDLASCSRACPTPVPGGRGARTGPPGNHPPAP